MITAKELLDLIESGKAPAVTSGKWKFEPSDAYDVTEWSVHGVLTSPDGKKSSGNFSYSDSGGFNWDFKNAGYSDEDEDWENLTLKVWPAK